MKIVRVLVAFFYLSTQLVFAQGGLNVPLPSIYSNSLSAPLTPVPLAPSLEFPSIKANHANDVKMFYIAGKFAGASLEVNGVRYEVSLNEAGNGLIIFYKDKDQDFAVGQGSFSILKNSMSLTLFFNAGAAFLVSYDYSKGEMAVSQIEENWTMQSSAAAIQKEELTSTLLYNEKGLLRKAYASGTVSSSDDLGNVTLGLLERNYSIFKGQAKISSEQLFSLTENINGAVTQTEQSKKYEIVNGVPKLIQTTSESKSPNSKDESSKTGEPVLFFKDSGKGRLESIMEEGMRRANRFALHACAKTNYYGMGLAQLPLNLVHRSTDRLEDWRNPLEGCIRYIYDSSGAAQNFTQIEERSKDVFLEA